MKHKSLVLVIAFIVIFLNHEENAFFWGLKGQKIDSII